MRPQIVTSKPKPPQDLWEQMDAIVETQRKENESPGFTFIEFGQRYKIGMTTAKKRVYKLLKEGKLIVGYRILPTGGRLKVFRPA